MATSPEPAPATDQRVIGLRWCGVCDRAQRAVIVDAATATPREPAGSLRCASCSSLLVHEQNRDADDDLLGALLADVRRIADGIGDMRELAITLGTATPSAIWRVPLLQDEFAAFQELRSAIKCAAGHGRVVLLTRASADALVATITRLVSVEPR